jgi:hypothetical protein
MHRDCVCCSCFNCAPGKGNYLQKKHGGSSSPVSYECGGEAMMEYKGYAAGAIDFDPAEKIFSGTVAGLRDVIHFEGRTATELERAFR